MPKGTKWRSRELKELLLEPKNELNSAPYHDVSCPARQPQMMTNNIDTNYGTGAEEPDGPDRLDIQCDPFLPEPL